MKLWGGRFEQGTDRAMDDFHSSIAFDQRLAEVDIQGSIAHATMLGERGVLAPGDAEKIVRGLREILSNLRQGAVAFMTDAEDIHMNIEKILTDSIGDAGKRLHTGRSRNDQVALDARMYVKGAIAESQGVLRHLMETITIVAKSHLRSVMPGYTHLQKAQPITLAHHLMAWFQMLRRDHGRLLGCLERTDEMPLGSGALAGTTYPLDRERVAEILGFSKITENSMDGVSDRDFILEYVSALSISMMHLSRMCEEIILWATNEFGFIRLDDRYSTGSSIMPQKKNPDAAELIRGKTGRVYGHMIALFTVMKGLPLAYNKDMQEDKEALFDAHDTFILCADIFTRMLSTTTFNVDAMAKSCESGFTNATDLADYLVNKGLPFRETHEIAGKMVLACEKRGIALTDLSLEEMKTYSERFEEDVYEAIGILTCVTKRNLPGGPAPEAVEETIRSAEEFLRGQTLPVE